MLLLTTKVSPSPISVALPTASMGDDSTSPAPPEGFPRHTYHVAE